MAAVLPVSNSKPAHTPVMVHEVLDALSPHDGGVYLDATFGAGGYTKALLDAAPCMVWGIDRDPEAVARGADLASRYPGRVTVLQGSFGDMVGLLADAGVDRIDGVAFDLGVSSMQIDDPRRGFSFAADGPLDMRMDCKGDGITAADVVNDFSEHDLANIIYRYGEERASRRIARAIVKVRATTPFRRTRELAEVIRRVVFRKPGGIDPATRTFQALRIHVNDELGELRRGLLAAEALLAPGGRLAVVSFHSLEDRPVKEFLRTRSGAGPRSSRHLPEPSEDAHLPSFRLLHRNAVRPAKEEVARNPRSRSARMRAAERTNAPPWPENESRVA